VALVMAALSIRFMRVGDRPSARKLFFSTLLYLPIAFVVLVIAWKN